jgi:hypothetical protein
MRGDQRPINPASLKASIDERSNSPRSEKSPLLPAAELESGHTFRSKGFQPRFTFLKINALASCRPLSSKHFLRWMRRGFGAVKNIDRCCE